MKKSQSPGMPAYIKVIPLVLFIFCFAGCGNSNQVQQETETTSVSTSASVESTEASVSETVTEEKSSEETAAVVQDSSTAPVTESYSEPETTPPSNFVIEGKWKNVGETGFGQAQQGAIVVFDGTNCNLYSPSDTYAFYMENNKYRLDATSMGFSQTVNFKVGILDNDTIELKWGDVTVKLKRVS